MAKRGGKAMQPYDEPLCSERFHLLYTNPGTAAVNVPCKTAKVIGGPLKLHVSKAAPADASTLKYTFKVSQKADAYAAAVNGGESIWVSGALNVTNTINLTY
jgi:hypothetical protein